MNVSPITIRAGKKISVQIGEVSKSNLKPESAIELIRTVTGAEPPKSRNAYTITFVGGEPDSDSQMQLDAFFKLVGPEKVAKQQSSEEGKPSLTLNMGTGKVFKSFTDFQNWANELRQASTAPRSLNTMTKFLRAPFLSRVHSLFKDFLEGKDYTQRLSALFDNLHDLDVAYASSLKDHMMANRDPSEVIRNGVIDHNYSKLYVIAFN